MAKVNPSSGNQDGQGTSTESSINLDRVCVLVSCVLIQYYCTTNDCVVSHLGVATSVEQECGHLNCPGTVRGWCRCFAGEAGG